MQRPEDDEEEFEGFDIPVQDAGGGAVPAVPDVPEDDLDWTRTESVRDDPESLGDEARKLWDALRSQFVEPVLRSYPEAAGHLTNAGAELASAVRSLIRGSEQLWAGGTDPGNADPSGAPDVVEVLEDEVPGEDGHPTGQA